MDNDQLNMFLNETKSSVSTLINTLKEKVNNSIVTNSIILILFLILTLWLLRDYHLSLSSKVTANVVSATCQKIEKGYKCNLELLYNVGNTQYTSMFTLISNQQYKAGQIITVFYDVDDPKVLTIRSTNKFLALTFGLVTMFITLWCLINVIFILWAKSRLGL